MLAATTAVGEIGWQGMAVWEPIDKYYYSATKNPRMWLVGGGSVGTTFNKQINTIVASVNTYWSEDGITWTRTNMKLGGGIGTFEPQYSSSEWASTLILNKQAYLGIWGQTIEILKGVNSTVNNNLTVF